MRKPLAVIAFVGALGAAPVIAQMAVPGTKDASRVTAGTYSVDGAHTQVMWRVNHLGFNDYFGIFGEAKGSLTIDPANAAAAKVRIEIPINSVATNNKDLTAHLLNADFFEAARYPVATFESTSVVATGETAKITGNLTIKGVTKPVVLDATFAGAGTGPMNKKPTIGFHATASIKRSDFNIKYGIPMVPDEVPLQISVAFEKDG